MGIIQQQTIRSTFANYIGLSFGTVTRLMMPFVITPVQIGLIALLDTISGTFTVFFNLGMNLILKRMFPSFRDEEKGHYGFLAFGFFLTLIGAALAIGVYFLIEDWILTTESGTSELARFAYLIPPLILFRLIFFNIDGYVKMLFSTVIGTFLDGLVTKILLFIGMLLFTFSLINFDHLVYVYAFVLALPGISIIFIAFKKTKVVVSPKAVLFADKKKLGSYVLFGILGGSAGSIVQYADQWMIHSMISDEMVGIYATMFFAATLIAVPARGVKKIASVVIAESWKVKDTKNIQLVYSKSCVNLLIMGFYLFLVGWAVLDLVLIYLPDFAEGKYVFFWLGLGKVVELGTGVNTDIIETSEKYRYNALFGGVLAVIVIGLNFVFIDELGLVGAGIASFCAMSIINIARGWFVYAQFGFKAFSPSFYKALVTGLIFLAIISFVDYELHPLAKMFINGAVVTILYWFIVIKFGFSEDINAWLSKLKKKING